MKIRRVSSCRCYDLILSKEELEKHFKILDRLYTKYENILVGGLKSSPVLDAKLMSSTTNTYNLVFQLAEPASAEYEKKMGIKTCLTFRSTQKSSTPIGSKDR